MWSLILLSVVMAVNCSTTVTVTTPPRPTVSTTVPPTILYDMQHHKAMVVAVDGCYEYHMTHQDTLDHASNLAALTQRIIDAFNAKTNQQETGHNHISHMSQQIVTACASIPVYSFD